MKRFSALLMSMLMLFGFAAPVLGDDETPVSPETEAVIILVPLQNDESSADHFISEEDDELVGALSDTDKETVAGGGANEAPDRPQDSISEDIFMEGTPAETTSVPETMEQIEPEEQLSQDTGLSLSASPASHTVDCLSMTPINGYTTLTFVVDGRYRAVITGLDPSTTEEEALDIAYGTAGGLDGGETFSISDAKIYNGYEDRFGAYYERFNRSLTSYNDLLNDPTATQQQIIDAGSALKEDALYAAYQSGDGTVIAALQTYLTDTADQTFLNALSDAFAVFNSAHVEEHREDRTYTDPNAVFSGQSALIDAEKTSINSEFLTDKEQDASLCWAASAADMLWYTGWGKQAVNPMTGATFASEDELLDWFVECFTDEGSYQYDGFRYLFEGINSRQNLSTGAKLYDEYYADADLPYALLNDYCVNLLADDAIQYDDISVLNDVLASLEEGNAVGLGLYTKNITGGHAVTAMGTVEDLFAQDEEDRYIAVFLADSDNDTPYLSEEEFYSELTEEDLLDRSARRNSYTMILTRPWTSAGGTYCTLDLVNYGDYVILHTTTLSPLNDENEAIALETDTDATKNARDYVDLLPVSLIVTDNTASNTFKQGAELLAELCIRNESAKALLAGNNPEYEMTLYRVNDKTGEVLSTVKTVNGVYEGRIGAFKEVFARDLIANDLPAGSYMLVLTGLNADKSVTEAYYINNLSVDGWSFIIVGSKVSHDSKKTHRIDDCHIYAYWTVASAEDLIAELCQLHTTEDMILNFNGEPVDPEEWEIYIDEQTGKTMLRLSSGYLKTLPLGDHPFTLTKGDTVLYLTVTVEALLG